MSTPTNAEAVTLFSLLPRDQLHGPKNLVDDRTEVCQTFAEFSLAAATRQDSLELLTDATETKSLE